MSRRNVYGDEYISDTGSPFRPVSGGGDVLGEKACAAFKEGLGVCGAGESSQGKICTLIMHTEAQAEGGYRHAVACGTAAGKRRTTCISAVTAVIERLGSASGA